MDIQLIPNSIDQSDKISNSDLKNVEEDKADQLSNDSLESTSDNLAETNVIEFANITTKPKTVVFQSELELKDSNDKVLPDVEEDLFLEPLKLIISTDDAAIIIQARARGFIQRKRYLILLHRHKSAIKIQSYWWALCDFIIVSLEI